MSKVGTVHVEIKPVLNEEALEEVKRRIEQTVEDALTPLSGEGLPEHEVALACDVVPGDVLRIPSGVGNVEAQVSGITTYDLAYHGGEPIGTSDSRTDHRWTVLHFATQYGGLVRFGHETVIRRLS